MKALSQLRLPLSENPSLCQADKNWEAQIWNKISFWDLKGEELWRGLIVGDLQLIKAKKNGVNLIVFVFQSTLMIGRTWLVVRRIYSPCYTLHNYPYLLWENSLLWGSHSVKSNMKSPWHWSYKNFTVDEVEKIFSLEQHK